MLGDACQRVVGAQRAAWYTLRRSSLNEKDGMGKRAIVIGWQDRPAWPGLAAGRGVALRAVPFRMQQFLDIFAMLAPVVKIES